MRTTLYAVAPIACLLLLPEFSEAQVGRGAGEAAVQGRFPAVVIPPPRLEPLLTPPPLPQIDPVPASPPPPARSSRCPIRLPSRELRVGAEGGPAVLPIPARTQQCIAGVEVREDWLTIQYLNTDELSLLAEPNTTGAPRHGQVYLANTRESLVLTITQASQ